MRRSKIQSLPASRSRGLRALRDDGVKELGNLRGTHFKLMLGNPRIGVKSVGQEIYGLRRVFVLKFQAGEIAQLYPLARVAAEGAANPAGGDFCFWRSVMASKAAPAVSCRDGSSQRPLATAAGANRLALCQKRCGRRASRVDATQQYGVRAT